MRTRAAVVVSGTVAAFLLVLPQTGGADPAGVCPDGLILVPASFVEQGTKKDKNANGLICAKVQDGKVVGGPDDAVDDILV